MIAFLNISFIKYNEYYAIKQDEIYDSTNNNIYQCQVCLRCDIVTKLSRSKKNIKRVPLQYFNLRNQKL